MNPNKISIDINIVQQLITHQFPQWANLKIKPVAYSGWDNRTFHLGDTMSIRLPSSAEYAGQVEKEQYWLPRLAPSLPFPISTPLAIGQPSEQYPLSWSIYQWIDGTMASVAPIKNPCQFATELASFLTALQQCDTTDGPLAGEHNFYRGGDIKVYDAETRQAIKALGNTIDSNPVTKIWSEALESKWDKPPVWIHGDIAPGNLLVNNGQLSAVIDFGQLGVGDPACDLAIAWTFFTTESRKTFKSALKLDEATWTRARGWALWKTLIVYAGLPGTNTEDINKSKLLINKILKD